MIKWTDLTLPPINLHNIGSLMLNTRAIEAERELDELQTDYDNIHDELMDAQQEIGELKELTVELTKKLHKAEKSDSLQSDYDNLFDVNLYLVAENSEIKKDYANLVEDFKEMEALYEQTKHELKLAKESIHVLLEDK